MKIECGVTLYSLLVQETEISQWEVPDFFLKIDFSHDYNINNSLRNETKPNETRRKKLKT